MKRKDGRRIKTGDPMYAIAAHVMAERSDSMNNIKVHIPVEPMRQYMRDQKKQGHNLSHIGLVLAAFIRTVAEYPQLNRFVVNKTIYARNSIDIGMVVLQPGVEDGETMAKMHFDRTDDVFEVQRKIDEFIEHNRETNADNATEKMIRFLFSVPGLVRFGVNVFKWADKHGLLPASVIEMSPFHATMTLSNLASLRTNYIYHHVYNFGTTSMLLTMGNIEEVPRRKKGEIVFERCIPMGLVMDERICHGSYYAIAFRRFAEYLENPSLLEGEPRVVNDDVL